MKFYVFKTITGQWRFSNLHDIGGEADTWANAYDEAFDLATLARPIEVCS